MVLVPAFQAERTVGAALRSTLRDLPRDSEVMVLDDGSTDRTAQVASAVDDPRVRVRSRVNGGVASALNELLDTTDSEYVARMDADDLVLPGRFRRQLDAVASGADAVFTTVTPWGADARNLPRLSRIKPDDFGFHLLLTNPVAHPTMLARREAIAAVDGYQELPTEDYDLWLRMTLHGARLRRLALPGLAYRAHPGQITASEQWRRSSWEDPLISSVYSRLAERLLGAPAQRITSLAIDDRLSTAEKRDRFTDFHLRFDRAVLGRPPAARRALRRKLEQRSRWFEHRLDEPAPRVVAP